MIVPQASPKGKSFASPIQVFETSHAVGQEPDYNAYIASLIRSILLTSPGERINRPDFGAGLRGSLFSALNTSTGGLAKTQVLENLTRWLGEFIQIEAIETRSENTTLFLDIQYIVLKRGERRVLNLEVVA